MWYFGLPTSDSFADGAIGYATCTDTLVRWLTAAIWDTRTVTGLTENTEYCFQVMGRDGDQTMTVFGASACETTAAEAAAIIFLKAIGRGIARGMKW